MSFIEVRNLKYRYPRTEKLALDGLGFNVEKGEFIGILGKNKAGKSTLCQAFMGLVPGMFGGAYGGQVMIDGMEASSTPVSVLCKKVGLVFQNPFNQLSGARDTVFGEVAFGLQNLGVPREEILKRVERSLELLEISPYRERNPFDLSGGQIQRVAIASILAMEPEVLVLDEPTSQLDPQGSEEVFRVVDRLASMETAAPDFRIFWDNAYGVHHIYQEVPLKNILDACEAGGHPNRAYYFFSTSKITFPGAGISLIASGPDNMKEFKGHMSSQTIGHDKLNQLRHVQYFKTPENIRAHMADLAEVLRPKFDMVLNRLEEELEGSGLAVWSRPKGGYFISLDTLAGCAKRTVQLAKEAGVTLTGAGATYPYKRDPQDRNIRIAPTYPTPEELKSAMDIFILCVKIAGIESVVNQGN